jgi:WD40 repeat protein/DNA-binding SARP family transcriptional activator/energy-coupling factor transporter ATP-binding protein EcfA2
MDGVEYRVLGPLTAVLAGNARLLGGRRQRTVLAALLANANHVMLQDALIEAVWAGDPPPGAMTTLHSYISNLRKELGGDQIARHGDGYRIDVDTDSFDALCFERRVEQARKILDAEPATALATLQGALGLWYGPAFGDLAGTPALAAVAAQLEELRLVAVELRIQADLATGNHAGVIGELETLVREHPYRERLRAQLMLALYRAGRQADSLRIFKDTQHRLVEELGINPSPELQRLEDQILHQDPALEFRREQTSPPIDRKRATRGYELRDRLGEGDFGSVYRAFQPLMGREVAVKVFSSAYVNHTLFVRRFETEAHLIARLEHPYIVPLFDFWRDPDGAYLVMPFLRGGNLSHALQRGGLSLAAVLRLLDHVGGAVAYAHRHGVVHRDIKPGNILLDEEGNAYLSDFGIATSHANPADRLLTTSPAYVSPEELRGEPVTFRSDVYSLGVLTHHLLTGMPPTRRRPLSSAVAAPAGVPAELGAVLQRAMDDQPARRYERVEPFLRAVRRAAGADEVSVAAPPTPISLSAPVRNPYKGLRSFLETDAVDFFGRDVVIDELLQAIRAQTLVAVVGPSGSGKSSVVRAGLVPALRAGALPGSGSWLITDMFPGSYPFEEVGAALLRVAIRRPPGLIDDLTADAHGLSRVTKRILPLDESQLVLIIDQFEELFVAVRSETTRRLFLDGLVAVAGDDRGRLRVILTLRADFVDRPLEYPHFGQVLKQGLVMVSPVSADGLAQAIAAPAQGVGTGLEPGLVGKIIRDVEGQPGALPLLQYALTELFNHRDGDTLTVAAYESTGGVTGALGRRAEELYEQLTPAGKDATHQLFLRLVNVDDTAGETRRRVGHRELKNLAVDQDALDAVIRQYGSFRLLSFDHDPVSRAPTIEVAHEALLREWPRLRGWIDAEREDLVVHRRFRIAVREWTESGGDPSFLLAGGRLEQAKRWQGATRIALTAEETAYLAASQKRIAAEHAATRRLRRLVISVLGGALAAAVALAAFAVIQRRAAQQEARAATVRELATESALALEEDPELSILLALRAVETARSAGETVLPESIGALQRAVQASRLELRMDDGALFVEFSPDGKLVATDSTRQSHVVIWDAHTGRRLETLTGAGDPVGGVAFSADGGLVATSYDTTDSGSRPAIVLWDPETGREVSRLMGPGRAYQPPVFSPDNRLLAAPSSSTGTPGRVTVWDLVSKHELYSFEPSGDAYRIGFLPDGNSLVVTEPTGHQIGLYATSDGHPIGSLDTTDFIPWDLSLSPTGERLASASQDSDAVQLWDLESRTLVRSIPAGSPAAVDWSPDGRFLAIADFAGFVPILNAETGEDVMVLRGSDSATIGVAFAPSGERLASVSVRGELLIWDVTPDGPPEVGAIAVGSGRPEVWSFSPDGSELGVSTNGGAFERFNAETGERLGSLTGQIVQHGFFDVVPSPDWRYVASVADDGTAAVRDMTSFRTLSELPPCTSPKAFSPDGSRLLLDARSSCTVGNAEPPFDAPPGTDLRSRVIDVASGHVVLDLGEQQVYVAAFNPEGEFQPGRYLAAVTIDGLALYDVTTGEHLATVDPDALTPSFDPHGRFLTWGTRGGRARVLDLARIVEGATVEEATVLDVAAHNGSVAQPAITADGLLATRAESLIRLWDVTTGDLLLELPRSPAISSRALSFNPEGTYLLYDDGGILRKYYVDLDFLIDLANNRLTRSLTADECQRYLDTSHCP